jgi:hypothetical protein
VLAFHGGITGGADVKRFEHGPHNETILLCCARCIWCDVVDWKGKLESLRQRYFGNNLSPEQVSQMAALRPSFTSTALPRAVEVVF